MPEHLRALTVILGLATIAFLVARSAFAGVVAREDLTRRGSVWVMVTLLAFLAHNPWIYVIGSIAILYFAQRREHNVMALFFFLLFAVPPFRFHVPGFGIFNYLVDLTHPRLLALVVLLPAYVQLRGRPGVLPFGRGLSDKLLLGFMSLTVLMELRETTVTDTLRQGFYAFIDVFLPYYVASRAVRDPHMMREAMTGFVIASLVLAGVGVFEFSKSWLLYSSLPSALGVEPAMGGYLLRGTSLRALASTGQPIVLGYVMVVAVGWFFLLSQYIRNTWSGRVLFAVLLAGLVAPVSRGPWLGAMVFMLVFSSLGKQPIKRLMKLFTVGSLLILLAVLSPAGSKVIDLLPYVGAVDRANVTYRERLLENAAIVIERNPTFGSVTYLQTREMQSMIQGQGIIDIVNTYIQVTLEFGVVGLTLFVAFFASIMLSMRSTYRRVASEHEVRVLGAALFATLAAILVMIFTVSSISLIPVVYWSVAGLGVAYIQMNSVKVYRMRNSPESIEAS